MALIHHDHRLQRTDDRCQGWPLFIRRIFDPVTRIHRIIFKTAQLTVLLVRLPSFLLPGTERIVTEHEHAELVPHGRRIEPLPVQCFFFGVNCHLAAKIPVQTLAIGMIRIFQVADSLGQDRIAGNKPYNRFYVAHGESIEDGFYTGAGQKSLAAAGRNLETHMRHSGEHVFVRFHLFLTSHLYAFAFPQQRIGFRVIVILVQVAQIAFQILQHLGLILF